jgi:hypothetical protein
VVAGGDRDRADPLDERLGDLAAPALVAEHVLQPLLELGVACARRTLAEVPLDLHALHAHELTVEVELDLAQDVLAISP